MQIRCLAQRRKGAGNTADSELIALSRASFTRPFIFRQAVRETQPQPMVSMARVGLGKKSCARIGESYFLKGGCNAQAAVDVVLDTIPGIVSDQIRGIATKRKSIADLRCNGEVFPQGDIQSGGQLT
jgi:hypothetical protein